MERDILNGGNNAEAIAQNIMKGFSNVDDVLNGEKQEELVKAIKDGNIDVITKADLDEKFGGVYYTKEDVAKAQAEVDKMISKGETDHLTEEEFEATEAAQNDLNSLKEVIVKGEDGVAALVMVQPHVVEDLSKGEDEEEDEEEEE